MSPPYRGNKVKQVISPYCVSILVPRQCKALNGDLSTPQCCECYVGPVASVYIGLYREKVHAHYGAVYIHPPETKLAHIIHDIGLAMCVI